MKPVLTFLFACFVCHMSGQISGKAGRVRSKQDTVSRKIVSPKNLYTRKTDTVPVNRIRALRYIDKPNSRYARIVGTVYTPLTIPSRYRNRDQSIPFADAATSEDSTLLAIEIEKLLLIIRNNYTWAIENYVDTLNEISKIKNLRWVSNKRVYKRDVNGIRYNISLLENIFRKADFDTQDLEIISYIFHNNDSLINLIRKGVPRLMAQTGIKFLGFTLLDSVRNEVPSATCYFVSKSSWRDLGDCQECPADPLKVNCPDTVLHELEKVAMIRKFFYDHTNPQSKVFPLNFGSYHLIILAGQKIRFHQTFTVDVNTTKTTLSLLYGL